MGHGTSPAGGRKPSDSASNLEQAAEVIADELKNLSGPERSSIAQTVSVATDDLEALGDRYRDIAARFSQIAARLRAAAGAPTSPESIRTGQSGETAPRDPNRNFVPEEPETGLALIDGANLVPRTFSAETLDRAGVTSYWLAKKCQQFRITGAALAELIVIAEDFDSSLPQLMKHIEAGMSVEEIGVLYDVRWKVTTHDRSASIKHLKRFRDAFCGGDVELEGDDVLQMLDELMGMLPLLYPDTAISRALEIKDDYDLATFEAVVGWLEINNPRRDINGESLGPSSDNLLGEAFGEHDDTFARDALNERE